MTQKLAYVGCKIPGGIKIADDVILRGCFTEPGSPLAEPQFRGYAITAVPAEAWDEWIKINQRSDMVTRGFVVGAPSPGEVRAAIARLGNVGNHLPQFVG